MIKQYVPYKIAFALKELGFNEECFGWYYLNNPDYIEYERCKLKDCTDIHISAPLWQQVTDWMRSNYDIDITIRTGIKGQNKVYHYSFPFIDESFNWNSYNSYEEAREAAILNAIEIIKNK